MHFVLIFLTILIVGCGDGGTPPTEPAIYPFGSPYDLQPQVDIVIKANEEIILSWKCHDPNGELQYNVRIMSSITGYLTWLYADTISEQSIAFTHHYIPGESDNYWKPPMDYRWYVETVRNGEKINWSPQSSFKVIE